MKQGPANPALGRLGSQAGRSPSGMLGTGSDGVNSPSITGATMGPEQSRPSLRDSGRTPISAQPGTTVRTNIEIARRDSERMRRLLPARSRATAMPSPNPSGDRGHLARDARR